MSPQAEPITRETNYTQLYQQLLISHIYAGMNGSWINSAQRLSTIALLCRFDSPIVELSKG